MFDQGYIASAKIVKLPSPVTVLKFGATQEADRIAL